MRRDCDQCGIDYEAKRGSSRFCSVNCRNRAAKDRKRNPAAASAATPIEPPPGVEAALVQAMPARVLDSPRGRIAMKLSRDIDASVPGTPGYSGLVRELRTLLDDLDAPAEVKPATPLALIRERHAGVRAG